MGRSKLRNQLLPEQFPNSEVEAVRELIDYEHSQLPPGTFLAPGVPLSAHYGIDHLQLMVQSPYRVFVYWELTRKWIQETLIRFPAEDRASFRIILRWIEEKEGGPPHCFDIGLLSHWWFDTLPGKQYQAELCLFSEDYGSIHLLSSNTVTTPRSSLGPPPEEYVEPVQTLPLLEDLVRQTGLGPQEATREVSVEEPEESLQTPKERADQGMRVTAAEQTDDPLQVPQTSLTPAMQPSFAVDNRPTSGIRLPTGP